MPYTLAEVAVCLPGKSVPGMSARLGWIWIICLPPLSSFWRLPHHYQDKSLLYMYLGTETLDGSLTPRMSTEGMISFMSSHTILSSRVTKETTANARPASQRKFSCNLWLRQIERLVHGLAACEKVVVAIQINQEHYIMLTAFTAGDSPLCKCLLQQTKKEEHCCVMLCSALVMN